jgi:hypothetical protein
VFLLLIALFFAVFFKNTCTVTTVNFSLFLRYKKNGADLVCGLPWQLKNIFEKILSQESMRLFQAVLG